MKASVSPRYSLMVMAVMTGGACGALSRFILNNAIMQAIGPYLVWGNMAFPMGILCINTAGGLSMGLLQGWIARSRHKYTLLYALLGTGYLGGFTTFSTFSLDTLQLYLKGDVVPALVNIFANAILAIGVAGFGYTIMIRHSRHKEGKPEEPASL